MCATILAILGVVWGGYIVQPQWFDNGPYEFDKQYETLAECQIATHGTDDICVGEQPSDRFTITSNVEAEVASTKLDFTQCDYWAGCYYKE